MNLDPDLIKSTHMNSEWSRVALLLCSSYSCKSMYECAFCTTLMRRTQNLDSWPFIPLRSTILTSIYSELYAIKHPWCSQIIDICWCSWWSVLRVDFLQYFQVCTAISNWTSYFLEHASIIAYVDVTMDMLLPVYELMQKWHHWCLDSP